MNTQQEQIHLIAALMMFSLAALWSGLAVGVPVGAGMMLVSIAFGGLAMMAVTNAVGAIGELGGVLIADGALA